jgi:hypothetical protein
MAGEKEVIYVGIDPGKSGGVGAIYPDGSAEAWHTPIIVTRKTSARKKTASGKKYVKITKTYNEPGMFRLLGRFRKLKRSGKIIKVGLERVGAAPKDGRTSAFTFGMGWGLWRMALTASGFSYVLVEPSKWKPALVGKGADKKESLYLARKLWPDVELPLMKDEAKAEALLIAEWIRRCEKE